MPFHLDEEFDYKEDPLITKERTTMKQLIKIKKAKFKYKTKEILKSTFCCHGVLGRPCLRKTRSLRGDLFFRIG